MKRYIKSLILIFTALILSYGVSYKVSASTLSGSGTQADPYRIYTLDDLNSVRNNLSASYILMKDIDAVDTKNWNSGLGWLPIGTTTAFTGNFNGNGHKILNLYINRPSENGIGLFKLLNYPAGISNTAIVNASIIGNGGVGVLVGNTHGVDYTNNLVEINNCYSSGNLSGDYWVGGLIGIARYSKIENSYSLATVSSTDEYDGGLIGYGNTITTINCYSTGLVESSETLSIGGFAGEIDLADGANCFYDSETSNRPGTNIRSYNYETGETITIAAGKTTSQMKTESTYTNWNFSSIWGISPDKNNGYPYLKVFDSESTVKASTISSLTLSLSTSSISFGHTSPLTLSYDSINAVTATVQSNSVYSLSCKAQDDFKTLGGDIITIDHLKAKLNSSGTWLTMSKSAPVLLQDNLPASVGTNSSIDFRLDTSWTGFKPGDYSADVNIMASAI